MVDWPSGRVCERQSAGRFVWLSTVTVRSRYQRRDPGAQISVLRRQSATPNGRLSQRSDGALERQSGREEHRQEQLIPTTPSYRHNGLQVRVQCGAKGAEVPVLPDERAQRCDTVRRPGKRGYCTMRAQHGRSNEDVTEADERPGTFSSAAIPQ